MVVSKLGMSFGFYRMIMEIRRNREGIKGAGMQKSRKNSFTRTLTLIHRITKCAIGIYARSLVDRMC